jgi:hypothetical protein
MSYSLFLQLHYVELSMCSIEDINCLHCAKCSLKHIKTVFGPKENPMNKYGGQENRDNQNTLKQKQ